MGFLNAANGAPSAQQQQLRSTSLPRPPLYTIALPALLPVPKCYVDSATTPDNSQTDTQRPAGLGILS
jgi:hypothetical protein